MKRMLIGSNVFKSLPHIIAESILLIDGSSVNRSIENGPL